MRLSRKHDSFSSDDEIPLKLVSKFSDDPNSYKTLCQPSINHCEFCDRIFKTKYSSLIHNATHIIIPLLNQKLIKCPECLFYFSTNTEYQQHLKKHTIKYKEHIKIRNRIKFEDDVIFYNSSNLLKDLNSQVNVTLENLPVSLIVKNKLDVKNNLDLNLDENNLVVDISDDDSPLFQNKYILGRKKTDCVNTYINGNGFKGLGTSVIENGEFEVYKSVHFDDLNKPKIVTCEHCKQKYPNEYSLILHQTSHLDFNRHLPPFCAACDWYIAGDKTDLKRHRRSHSPNTRQKLFACIEKCLQCGLSYRSYINHVKNYHNDNNETYNKISRVCDLCYQFLKSSKLRSYVKIGVISKVGKRFKCSHCMRKFFEVNEVQKTEFIQKWCMKRNIKKMTNDQRLKKIQFRFKQINNMNKL